MIEDSKHLKTQKSLLSSLKKVEDVSRSNYLALFPDQDTFNRSLPNAFVYLDPMEGVGGDGFWLYEHKQSIFLVLFDCMGHGYKASMMVRMYIRTLDKIVKEDEIYDPAKILIAMHNIMAARFKDKRESSLGTGADFGVLKINPLQYEMYYAGAKMDLYEVNELGLDIYKANRKQIGEMFDYDRYYETTYIDLNEKKKSKFYLFSDGVTDMMGGPENKRFGTRRVKDLLLNLYPYPMKKQKSIMATELNKWQGSNAAMDDSLIMGFSV